MQFWESGLVLTGVLVTLLLLPAMALRRLVPAIDRLGIPDSIIAGLIGFVLGPSVLALLPLDVGAMESAVYHGLALVYIAIGLQTPPEGKSGAGARSVAFSVPFMAVLQGFVGLIAVLLISRMSTENLHPGFGLMLPLSFSQGPGQALAVGSAWESAGGMPDGGSVGLVYFAIALLWALFLGVPLVRLGTRLGWAKDPGRDPDPTDALAEEAPEAPLPPPPPGGVEAITAHVALIAGVYLATWLALRGITALIPDMEKALATIWGFHFIIASFLAIAGRKLAAKAGAPTHNGLCGRLASLVVDVTAVAALAAVRLEVLRAHWLPILIITSLGGLVTTVVSVWISRRAWPSRPFEHALLLFGTATGTMPTALALLRMVDPDLKGPAASNYVLGTPGAVVLGAPLLVFLNIPVGGWPDRFESTTLATMGLMALYLAILLLAWWKFGQLRFLAPLTSPWPRAKE